jgi:alpha-beta hydrolase superfamily lysophospholipase
MRRLLIILAGIAVAVVAAFAGVIAFGTAAPPPPVASVDAGIAEISRTRPELPPVRRFTARDGAALAYRVYPAAPDRVVVLIHGSSGSSASVHGLAKALAAAGITVYAPDIRGHGESGPKGDIGYIGELEDDLADLLAVLGPAAGKRILVGHSSGGGFVLRVAAGPIGERFDGYLLLSPFLGWDAPTSRPGTGGWAAPYIPRIVALLVLSRIGVHAFDGLPVIAFAVPPDTLGTRTYSFRLWASFAPRRDWRADIRAIRRPAAVLVGADDELFYAGQYAPVFAALRPEVPVTVVPGTNHMQMVTAPAGWTAATEAAARLLR